jgi:hypothetical protein
MTEADFRELLGCQKVRCPRRKHGRTWSGPVPHFRHGMLVDLDRACCGYPVVFGAGRRRKPSFRSLRQRQAEQNCHRRISPSARNCCSGISNTKYNPSRGQSASRPAVAADGQSGHVTAGTSDLLSRKKAETAAGWVVRPISFKTSASWPHRLLQQGPFAGRARHRRNRQDGRALPSVVAGWVSADHRRADERYARIFTVSQRC